MSPRGLSLFTPPTKKIKQALAIFPKHDTKGKLVLTKVNIGDNLANDFT